MRRMIAAMGLGLGIALTTLSAAPAEAQRGGGRLLTVFGNDRCPRDEICVRAPESERYRIPKELRGEDGEAAALRWGDRAKSIEYAGANGTMSCSPVGPGGASGCMRQMQRAQEDERRSRGERPGINF